MSVRWLPLACLAALVEVVGGLPSHAADPTRNPVRFGGEVAREQTFEREIGRSLVFRLMPSGYGWTIWVGTRTNPDADFSAVATPPFRGMNHRFIEAWHFRNADNSGPNEAGPRNVNAPQEVRKFAFVVSESDHRLAAEALDKLLWPASSREREKAERLFEVVEARAMWGRLVILDIQLGNMAPSQRAWVEWMRFEVELFPP